MAVDMQAVDVFLRNRLDLYQIFVSYPFSFQLSRQRIIYDQICVI